MPHRQGLAQRSGAQLQILLADNLCVVLSRPIRLAGRYCSLYRAHRSKWDTAELLEEGIEGIDDRTYADDIE